MKKQILFLLSAIATVTLLGQPMLSYENHRLLAGMDNPMMLCNYSNPGQSGPEMVWDFSDIQQKKEFTGRVVYSYDSDEFSGANTRLVEFSTNYYFDINESGIEQVGYASKDGKTQVKYENPYVKMKYPFSYQDNYSTNFSGTYLFNKKQIGTVSGDGVIEADAWGELRLPNDKIYTNTIRVKSTKNYTIRYSETNSNTVEIQTYRWYNSSHRYPLLVLTEFKTLSGSGERINYQAAYNSNAVAAPSSLKDLNLSTDINVYPNPAASELFLDITSNSEASTHVSIIDMAGKKIINEKEISLMSGSNKIDLSSELQTLKAGTYIVRIQNGNKPINKEIVVSTR